MKPVDYSDRYNSSTYKSSCKKAHQSTGNRCVISWRKSEEMHHLCYVSKLQWLIDFFNWLRGKPPDVKRWGWVPGREIVGWNAVPISRRCHTIAKDCVHSSKHWKRRRDPDLNTNTELKKWELRLRWLVLKWLVDRGFLHPLEYRKTQ